MNARTFYAALLGLSIGAGTAVFAVAKRNHNSHASKYQGEETRAIKSLSDDDVAELLKGGGWGLAKAAELNGLPGPAHLLEMKDEIGLDSDQLGKIEALFMAMREDAKSLGKQMIDLETELEAGFRDRSVDETALRDVLGRIAEVRASLRFAHLSAHLETPKILTERQIGQYNELRGYNVGSDPCANVPAGHDETMWRKHNGCQ